MGFIQKNNDSTLYKPFLLPEDDCMEWEEIAEDDPKLLRFLSGEREKTSKELKKEATEQYLASQDQLLRSIQLAQIKGLKTTEMEEAIKKLDDAYIKKIQEFNEVEDQNDNT